MIHIAFDIPSAHGPALRAAIEEISNEVGERLVGQHRYEREDALTKAACALGALRAAIHAAIPHEDEHYA